MRKCLAALVLMSLAFVGPAAPTAAVEIQKMNIVGQIVEVQEKAIRVVKQNGTVVLVHLNPEAKIGGVVYQGAPKPEVQITGRLSPKILKTVSLPVRIVAELDENGNAVGEVKEVKVFSPNEKDTFGVKPANPGLPVAEEKGKVTPGLYIISGPVQRLSRNSLTLSLAERWKCDLASDVQVAIEASDHRFATPGDAVTVDAESHDETEVWGATIKILKPTPPDVLEADKLAAAKPVVAQPPMNEGKDPMVNMPAEPAPPQTNGEGKRDKPGRILKIN